MGRIVGHCNRRPHRRVFVSQVIRSYGGSGAEGGQASSPPEMLMNRTQGLLDYVMIERGAFREV